MRERLKNTPSEAISTYTCRFPGQPRATITLRSDGENEIQFGSEVPQELKDYGSAGTGMYGHAYATGQHGKLYSFVVGAGPSGQATLRIWPSRESYDAYDMDDAMRGVPRPKPISGTCRETSKAANPEP
jgi:hypothetical protein